MLTDAEKAELFRLDWTQRYYLDAWLALMNGLDTLRPGLEKNGAFAHQLLELLDRNEINDDEARRMRLDALRDWWTENRELAMAIRPACPN